MNSLDTALIKGPQQTGSITQGVRSASEIPFRRWDPALPRLREESVHRVHWRAREVPVRVSPTLVIGAWTFEGDVPGPTLHVREGDTIEFTLTNDGAMPHSMDAHSVRGLPAPSCITAAPLPC
jgi:nitrite reductase (NO-forming)